LNILGPDKTYIDYFQGVCASQLGLSNCFGIRVRDGAFCAVVKLGDGEANPCGKEFHIPVQPEKLPSHIRMIVDDHLLNYPASDLIDVLTGKKSFEQALASPILKVRRA
jgi:hypothetical protein